MAKLIFLVKIIFNGLGGEYRDYLEKAEVRRKKKK